MARNRYLDRKGFRLFLEEKGDEFVGFTRNSDECPVATYLTGTTNRVWHASPLACVPQVDPEPGEDKFDLNHEFRPPRWAVDFIYALDARFGRHMVAVTGNDALDVLEEAVV